MVFKVKHAIKKSPGQSFGNAGGKRRWNIPVFYTTSQLLNERMW